MRKHSQGGYIALILLLLGAATVAYFYFSPGITGQKSTVEQQRDAIQSAKSAQQIGNAHNQEIEKALEEY